MRFHVVTVPVERPAEALEELNAFLARHRVLSVDRHLIHDGARSAWTFCVTWVPLDGAAEDDGADDASECSATALRRPAVSPGGEAVGRRPPQLRARIARIERRRSASACTSRVLERVGRPQRGVAAALAVTAHADASAWRRAELLARPPLDA